jgi:ubiquinone biosynthesis protein
MASFWRVRHFQRYHKLIGVFARHGFGSFIEAIRIDRYLPLPPAMFRQPAHPAHLTPAEHFRLALEELGPTFIKLGQIVSTRPDLLPADFIVELNKLQDSVRPEPWEAIDALLEQEFGPDYTSHFPEIDRQPLGSASLSQVHAALLEDGSPVVLKVQRPNISRIIEEDLEILIELAGIAQRTEWGKLYNPVDIVKDFAYVLQSELDFRLEGVNADRFRSNFAGERRLYIPKIYWDYCTRRVLVEERLSGIKIDRVEALEAAGFDREAVATLAADIVVKEIIEHGFFHADPHPGNFFVMDHFPCDDEQPEIDEEPVELTETPETGSDDNGDEDEEEEAAAEQADRRQTSPVVIGAMDFGMVGYVTQTDRLNLLQAFLLASRRDSRGLVEHLSRIGAFSPGQDPSRLEYELDRLLTRYQGIALKHIESRQVAEELMQLAYQHRIRLPTDFWLLFKTLTMMDGLARQIDPDIDVFLALSKPVKRLVRTMHLPWVFGPQAVNDVQTLVFALKDLPSTMERLVRALQRGELPLSFQIGIKKETMDRVDRVSTRISLSVLIAAFIVGLALMFDVASENRMALVLVVTAFITSLLLGIWYIITVMRSGRS